MKTLTWTYAAAVTAAVALLGVVDLRDNRDAELALHTLAARRATVQALVHTLGRGRF